MSSENVFLKVANFFKLVAHDLARFFVAVFGAQAAHDFAVAAEKILSSDFGKVILSIVTGLQGFAAANGGSVARSTAFQQITAAAVAAGLDLKESVINLLIELALQKIKGTFDHLGSLGSPSSPEPASTAPATSAPETASISS